MADQNKQPTREEQRKNMISSLESNLKNDFYLNVLGSNTLRDEAAFYGTRAKGIGETQYSAAMKSKDASELRQSMYNQLMENEEKERADLGIADMPDVPYPTNYQLTKYALKIINQSINALPLANLEKIIGDGGVKLEIPNELKQYEAEREELIRRAQEQKKRPEEIGKMLDRDSEIALQRYKELVHESIKTMTAYKMLEAHKYDYITNEGEKIAESYRKAKGIPEPEKPKDGKK